jgi:ureidoglycolate hydrolase
MHPGVPSSIAPSAGTLHVRVLDRHPFTSVITQAFIYNHYQDHSNINLQSPKTFNRLSNPF